MLLAIVGCSASGGSPSPSSTPTVAPTATAAAQTATPLGIGTRSALATPTTQAKSLQTFHTQIAFDTYEAEETVQAQLGRLPGVASVNVTQLDVTVQYDPGRLTDDDILRALRANPEVRIKDDSRARP